MDRIAPSGPAQKISAASVAQAIAAMQDVLVALSTDSTWLSTGPIERQRISGDLMRAMVALSVPLSSTWLTVADGGEQ